MKFINLKFLIIFISLLLPALILFFKSIEVKPQLEIDGQIITFPNTDDLQGESLIIRSDQEHYTGETGSDAYFSITNTSKIDEPTILLFYFPGQFIPNRDDPPGTQPATVISLEQREGDSWRRMEFFSKNIKIKDDLLGPAITKRKPIPEDFEIKAGTQIEVKAGQTVYFKSRISFRSTDSGEFWIEALGKNGGYGLLDPTYSGTHFGSKTSTDTAPNWFASGSLDWTHRKKITINSKKVSGGSNLTNFPVLFSVIDSTLATTANGGKTASGSGEFVFTSSDGTTVLPHEIERYSATTGEFIGWVNVTTLSATNDTNLYVYYGGPAAGTKTNQRKTAVWDSNYKGVWHLPNGSTLTALDSTSNGNNGTLTNTPTATTGPLDGAASFASASLEFINIGNVSSLNAGTSDVSVSAWIKTGPLTAIVAIAGKGHVGGDVNNLGYGSLISFVSPNVGKFRYQILNVGTSTVTGSTNVLTDNAWYYVVGTTDRDSSTGHKAYVDGKLNGIADPTALNGVNLTSTLRAMIAARDNNAGINYYFNGSIDEVRISIGIARSAGWITTEYNNQFSPSTFYTLGGLEAKTSNGPGLKIKGGVKFK